NNVCLLLGKFTLSSIQERAAACTPPPRVNWQAVGSAELSSVTDVPEPRGRCRPCEVGECPRGGSCDFVHLHPSSWNPRRQLGGRGPQSPPRSHTGRCPRERTRRLSPDHGLGCF
uniref:C3H1-type domain-containing protein n=1 Tax=Canis lupus dingo TaxID=286419 RepID=A0A8C0KM48_CANLU